MPATATATAHDDERVGEAPPAQVQAIDVAAAGRSHGELSPGQGSEDGAAVASPSTMVASPFARQQALCPTPPQSAALSPGTTSTALEEASALPYCLYAAEENPLGLPIAGSTHQLRSGLPPPTSPGSDAMREDIGALLNRMCHAVAYRSAMCEHGQLRADTIALEHAWRQRWIEDALATRRTAAASATAAASCASGAGSYKQRSGSDSGGASVGHRKVSTARRASASGVHTRHHVVSTSSARQVRRMSLDDDGYNSALGGMGVVVQGNAKLRAEVAAIKTKLRGALGRGDRHAAAAAVLELAQLEPEMKAAVKSGGGLTSHIGNSVAISSSNTGGGGSSHHLSEEVIRSGVSLVSRGGRVYNRAKFPPQLTPSADGADGGGGDAGGGGSERRVQLHHDSHLSIESKSKPICLVRRTSDAGAAEFSSAVRTRRCSEAGHKSDRAGDARQQVPGQFSYLSPSPFEGGGGQWQRRMLELQALQSESVKWEHKNEGSKGGANVVALVSGAQSILPSSSSSSSSSSIANDRPLPLWR